MSRIEGKLLDFLLVDKQISRSSSSVGPLTLLGRSDFRHEADTKESFGSCGVASYGNCSAESCDALPHIGGSALSTMKIQELAS